MISTDTPELEFGIIHLSDIHFSVDAHLRTDLFFDAIRDEFLQCGKIFLVVSGDIAKTGQASEYDGVLDFFIDIVDRLKQRYPKSKIKYILVPGNHDCNFKMDSQLRQNVIDNINYDKIGNDNSILETCLKVQSDFWDFYDLLCDDLPENKVYYPIKDNIGNKSICFHCFNTAWMSQINETPGTLFFPIKKIPKLKEISECDINISIYHHPISWFNPNTAENNKKEFQNIMDSLSSLQIIGHEHENELRQTEDLDRPDSRTLCASGEIFYNSENLDKSGFQIFVFKTDSNLFRLNRFRWKDSFYQRYTSEREYSLEKKPQRPLELRPDFVNDLNRISIPLSFGESIVSLSDIYIYPDLEDMDLKANETIDYIDAESLLSSKEESTFLLEGDSQIGKSALLNMLFLRFYEKGFYPILLKGSDINNNNIEKIIKQSFIKQYNSIEGAEDKFRQLPKEKKILLLDDMHICSIRESDRQKILQTISDLFEFKFITIDTAFSVLPQCQASFKNLKTYSIKPLGYSKRDVLVNRYLKCKNPKIATDTDLFDRSKEMFNNLCAVLGDKLIPPYPVFILTILQSLEYTPLNTNETSYGYCYQTLIHLALNQVGVTKDHIDAYINFITELAFELLNNESDSITNNDLQKFHSKYTKDYWAPSYESMESNLLKSKILKNEFGSIKFGYVYIHYFLAAKKIADMIDTPEGKKIVLDLFENLHVEKNANVLVFITHHTKNISFIEESIFNAMIPFEKTSPITLAKDCNYYNLLQDVVKEIKQEVIELRDPARERERSLNEQDNIQRKRKDFEEDDQNMESDIELRPFLQSFRAIEIVGQIIKNRKGSLKTDILKQMITELYLTAFRQIGFLGEQIKVSKDDLVKRIEEKVTKRDSGEEIEKKIYRFLQFISLQACLGVFSKIIHHVGVKELRDLYNEVAQIIGTPASKIVSFSINTYYGKIDIKELEDLAEEFKDNIVVMQIIRSRVKSYIYNNQVDYRLKQKIGSCLEMRVPAYAGNKNIGY
jgi:hypothetical protein